MKTCLLTVADFVKNASTLSEDMSVRLYYLKDETIPVHIIAGARKLDVEFVEMNSPEELIFDVGMFLGTNRFRNEMIELYCGDGITIPESLAQSLDIKKLNGKSGKTIRKPRTAKKSEEKTLSAADPLEPKESSERKSKRPEKSASKEIEVAEVAETKTRRKKKDTVQEELAPIEAPVLESAPQKKSAISEVKTETKESETEEDKKRDEKIFKNFHNQISVRGGDLRDAMYSDETLTSILIKIFKDESSIVPRSLLQSLNETFTKTDANIIYKWVSPNVKKLHELAAKYFE